VEKSPGGGTCLPAGRLVDAKIMYFTYVIKSKLRNYIYVGITSNLEKRLLEHNLGKNKTTKPYVKFELITAESYNSRLEARKREKWFKSGEGKEFLKMHYMK